MPKFQKIYAHRAQKQLFVTTFGSNNTDFVRIIQKFG